MGGNSVTGTGYGRCSGRGLGTVVTLGASRSAQRVVCAVATSTNAGAAGIIFG